MKPIRLLAAALGVIVSTGCVSAAFACDGPARVCETASETGFDLIRDNRPAAILIDAEADPAVQRVAASFQQDLARVSGQTPQVLRDAANATGPVVLVGVLGQSPLIDDLVARGKLDVSDLAG
ncbi:MAG: hypothetical protein CME99_01615, partial [Hyphomonas sp.]